MAQPKKHHYVPQALLRQFSNDGEQIYVFDKRTGRMFSATIADTGSENHFNTIDIGGKQINLEDRFCHLDGRLAELIQLLNRDRRLGCLTAQDRYDLAFLAVVQFIRVKVQRTTLMSIGQQVAESFAERGIPNAATLVGTIDENQAKIISLDMLRKAPVIAHALIEKDWSLHLAPADLPLWISDCPIVMSNEFDYGGTGLTCEGVNVFWPVSRSVILRFACPTIANKVEITNTAQARTRRSNPTYACGTLYVDFVNQLQVMQSGRFVYGPTADFALAEKLLAACPEVKDVASKLFVSKMGEPPRNDRMPSGKWLVVHGGRTSYQCPIQSWVDVDGEFQVCVTIDSWETLQQIFKDPPYSEIGIFEDGSHSRHMRDVSIEPVPGKPMVVRLVHADPAIRAMDREFLRRQKTGAA